MNQNDVIDGFRPDYARKHGCAWFVWGQDPVHHPEKVGGWASLGGEPAFEFHRPQDLPKDVVWWTNLSKSEAWSLGRWSHIKHAGFLGPDWLSLMSEWGFPQEISELKIACSGWSEVVARMGEWLSRWSAKLPHQEGGPRPNWSWGDGEFHEALAERLGWSMPKMDTHPALAAAYLDQVDQEIAPSLLAGKRKITLTLPRAEHARHLWATRYPTGAFDEVPVSEWPNDPEQRWAWLRAQKLPVLVRFDQVQWKPGCTELATLWWGLRGRRFAASAMDPVWMTAEEALEMGQWIDSTPEAALRAHAWGRADDVLNWPIHEMGWLADSSILKGLLCEGLWRAAATPVRTPTKRIKSGVTPRAVWWRAADRRMTFACAKALKERGFSILSYGQGGVTVLFDPTSALNLDWAAVLKTTQMRTPMMLAQHVLQPEEPSSGAVDVWLKKTGNLESWLWLDRLLWPWMGAQKQELKPILEHAMRSLAALPPPSEAWAKEWKSQLRLHAKQAVQSIVDPVRNP